MNLSEDIKAMIGSLPPNPADWRPAQRILMQWAERAFQLESEKKRLQTRLAEIEEDR